MGGSGLLSTAVAKRGASPKKAKKLDPAKAKHGADRKLNEGNVCLCVGCKCFCFCACSFGISQV